MRCTITLIASIKTLTTFYLSFKAKFPVSYPGSSHRPASTVLKNCKLMKALFPLLCQLPTSLIPMQGSKQVPQRVGQKLMGNGWESSSASSFTTPSSQPISRICSYADVSRHICWTGCSSLLSNRGNRLLLRSTVVQLGSSRAAKCTFPY